MIPNLDLVEEDGLSAAPDATIEYDENGTDKLRFAGSQISFDNTTQSTDKDTGSANI